MSTWEDARGRIEALLPRIAAATARIGGVMIGGTALAFHLEHRPSFDIDIQVLEDFDEREVEDRLVISGGCERLAIGPNRLAVTVDGVKVEVGKSSTPQRLITAGPVIAGMPTASLPDLFALKLRAVRNRAQLRDYIDLAALTENMAFKEGIRFYAMRYGLYLVYDDLSDVFSVLTPPPVDIPPDPLFDHMRTQVLETVHTAAERALRWVTGNGMDGSSGKTPGQPRTPPVGR